MDDSTFDRILSRYRTMKRHATAKNALDVTAFILLGASLIFWATAFWQLFAPSTLIGILQVGVLAIVMAVVAPVLWSALVPTTPAGQFLQKSQLRTVGFAAITGAAIFLSKVALDLVQLWLASQLSVSAPDALDLGYPLSIAMVIAFILVPALAWTQVAPEKWLQQIEQAHQVKKLEALQAGELAIIKTRLLWAKQKAAASYANLLPIEQQEIHDTLRGLFLSIGDTQRALASTLRDSNDYDREFGIIQDQQVYDALDYVAQAIEAKRIDVPPLHVDSRLQSSIPRDDRDVERVETVSPHVDSRLQSSIPREAPDVVRRQVTSGDDAYARAARRAFGVTPWTVKRLAEKLDVGETTARQLKDDWTRAGLIREAQLGRWCFTEREAA